MHTTFNNMSKQKTGQERYEELQEELLKDDNEDLCVQIQSCKQGWTMNVRYSTHPLSKQITYGKGKTMDEAMGDCVDQLAIRKAEAERKMELLEDVNVKEWIEKYGNK